MSYSESHSACFTGILNTHTYINEQTAGHGITTMISCVPTSSPLLRHKDFFVDLRWNMVVAGVKLNIVCDRHCNWSGWINHPAS